MGGSFKTGGSMGLAIAGFHRSGTSSITQHLAKSGLHPGCDIMKGGKFNPYGHFEDWGPVRFHDAALGAAHLDWACVTRERIPLSTDDKKFIHDYCDRRNQHDPNWGFKDPRICHFLDDWMGLVPNLKALIVYRSPAECSWSIYRRTAFQIIHGTLDENIATRILKDPDHALALWITQNRKLLEVVQRYPERTVVVSHAGFAAGFNVATLIRERFGFALTPSDVTDTFRAKTVTRHVDPLPVSSNTLREEALELWGALQALDHASHLIDDNEEERSFEDPSGLILMNKLLAMQTTEARMLLEKQAHQLKAAKRMAKKLQHWQFLLSFGRRRKYQDVIEKILH